MLFAAQKAPVARLLPALRLVLMKQQPESLGICAQIFSMQDLGELATRPMQFYFKGPQADMQPLCALALWHLRQVVELDELAPAHRRMREGPIKQGVHILSLHFFLS